MPQGVPLMEEEVVDEFEKAFNEDNEAGESAVDDTAPEEPEVQADEPEPEPDWKHMYKSDAGRMNAYQNQIEQLKAENEQLRTPLKEVQEEEGPDLSSWDDLQETDPELAQAIEQKFGNNNESTQLRAELDKLKQSDELRQTNERAMFIQSQQELLYSLHPDCDEIVNSDDFKSWADRFPGNVNDIFNSNDASSYVKLFDLYKQKHENNNVSSIAERRKKSLQNSASQVKGRNPAPKATATNDFESAFNFYSKEEDKKKAQ